MPDVVEQQVGELEQDAEISQQQQEEGQEQVQPEKKETDELRAAMTELAGTVKTLATPPKKDEELTEEQKQELWAVYNPEKGRPDFMKKFFRLNPEATAEEIAEAKDLFADMQKGFVKQAVVGAKNLMEIELGKLREEYKHVSDYVLEQRAEKTREKFYKDYPALKDDKFSKIVAAAANLLKDQNFDSEKSYFKALAESAAETIKGVLPEFDLGATVEAKTKTTAGTTPRLPRTSAGGTGGTGGGPRAGQVTGVGGQIDELEP